MIYAQGDGKAITYNLDAVLFNVGFAFLVYS